MSEFYKNMLFDNVYPWTTSSVIIASTISVIGLVIFGFYVRNCWKPH